jgi:hypothetical protein
VEKLRRDLEKAQKEVKEGDIEKERFQAQLEMLVQELEKKQVSQKESSNQGRLRTKNRLRHRESPFREIDNKGTGQS